MKYNIDLSKIHKETITKTSEYIDFVFSISSYDKRIKRSLFNFAFRGQQKDYYKLTSSFKRNCEGNELIAEKRLVANFEKYGQFHNPAICNSVWMNLIIAQHHSTPTRLLDWTFSPLVALHFATNHVDNNEIINEDAVVWVIDIQKINNLLPENYQAKLKESNALAMTIKMLDEMKIESIQQYNNDMNGKSFVFLEPPSINDRIINQYSLFSILPDKLDPLDYCLEQNVAVKLAYKIIIPSVNLYTIRDELDIMGINERILFPGLDGTSKWLKRYYHHRPKNISKPERV
jgi:hypothetical protein